MTIIAPAPMPVPRSVHRHQATVEPPEPGRLVSMDGRHLPLAGTQIEAKAAGGIARVTLRQRFANPYDEPLAVRYQVPLPADGAVSGFAFQLGDQRVEGVVDTKKAARQRFEDAIVEGRTASLLEQERSSLFTQEVGNIPPRTEVVAEIVIDQKLAWLSEGQWEWRFPTVVAPRYLARTDDAERVAVAVADDELAVRTGLSLHVADAVHGRPESPSHGIVSHSEGSTTRIELRSDARLDRDVVVRWPVADQRIGATLSVARPHARHVHGDAVFGLLTLVPPSDPDLETVPRDLVLLIDTSGSMHGEPLAQARRVCLALVESLGEQDRLEMVSFSWKPERWRRGAVPATTKNKRDARRWLKALRASGGTEMRGGIIEALDPLRARAQRQVVLVSDGLIGAETEVVRTVAQRLPASSRVHTVGVGSAVNRSLTGPVARAGRGVEAVIGIGEDAERAALRLLAHTAAPVLVGVEVSGDALLRCAPERVPDLMAGAPALLSLCLKPDGGTLVVRGDCHTGTWERRLVVPAAEHGEGEPGIVNRYARERVEDLELRRASHPESHEVDSRVEAIGCDFQIATRLTSWVAVSATPTVDATAPSRFEAVPHELPHGMSVANLGLRAAAPTSLTVAQQATIPTGGAPPPAAMPGMAAPPMRGAPPAPSDAPGGRGGGFKRRRMVRTLEEERELAKPRRQPGERRVTRSGSRFVEVVRSFFSKDEEAPPRDLEGIVRVHDDRLVIDVTLKDGVRWEPLTARIELSDGSTIEAVIDVSSTTRACDGKQGRHARLVLTWSGSPLTASPTYIHLTGGDALRILLFQPR